jgi:hypothetical protein
MNRKTLLGVIVCAALLIGTGVSALAGVGQAAVGNGIVQNDAGLIGEFQFKVNKAIFEQQGSIVERVGGFAAFRTVIPGQAAIEINCKRVTALTLGDDKRTAEFSGPAVMFVRNQQGISRVQGMVHWRVADRGRPGPLNPPDLVGVHFTPEDGSPTFNFGGAVVRGDVRVFEVTDTR